MTSPQESTDLTIGPQRIHSVSRDEKTSEPASLPPSEHSDTILTGRRLAVAFLAILLSQALTALDQTILATALPRIASDFDSFSLQGWVATSFILSQTVFILFHGQLLRIYPAKWILVGSIILFEAGSVLCSVAQNVQQLIAGRTISGPGAAGIFVAMLQVVAQITRLEDRPRLFGLFGANFALASVVGPLLGGAFSRTMLPGGIWCFYINLPLGGVSIVGVILLLKAAPPLGSDPSQRSPRDILRQTLRLDFLGAVLIAGAVTCLILALQWGGNTKPWGDRAVIICFAFAGVLVSAFITWEIYMGERAMTPTTIYKSRSVWAILAYCFLTRFSFLLFSYYIPILYQAVRHRSATQSGIDLLPFMLSVVLTVIAAGQIIGKTGYLWPFLLVAPFFLAIGSALLYTLTASSSSAKIIGFQILVGIGTGMGMQNSLLAIQVEFRDTPHLIGQATSMATFAQFLGGTLGLGVAEPVFASELAKFLQKYAPATPAQIVKESPTAIYTELPVALIPGVVRSYTAALKIVFVLGVPVAGFALLSACLIQNVKIGKTGSPAHVDAEMEKDFEV
ncbi:Major facilitator transporter-like protein [Mycena venus]|uniref:Major facilitator transporter-like protein n=1 Tax=Mycena venus TaxID=2733690 RepID=A0A8H7D4G2_9AGAR|nr:Major facilitator transporter-like protein [Mycena venus]